jgi:hypothetical protein
MRRLSFPIALAGLVVAACEDGSAPLASTPIAVLPPCSGLSTEECQPLKGGGPAIVVENRTGAPIAVAVASAGGVRIDRQVVDGILQLPIPTAPGSAERTFTLDPQASSDHHGQITVVDRAASREVLGSFIRLADGPTFLAVGTGKVVVRPSADGVPFLEEEDPKTLTLVRRDRVVAECAGGSFVPPFDPPPIALYDSIPEDEGPVRIRSVTRDAEGCREIEIGDDREAPITEIRACLPDEAYPFVDGEDVRVSASGDPETTAATYFTSPAGNVLILSRIAFETHTSSSHLEGFELAFDEDESCANIDPLCGHVDVPVRVSARTRDGTLHRITYGTPVHDIGEDTRFFVLGATARPVADKKCVGKNDQGASRTVIARAWVATVTRAE